MKRSSRNSRPQVIDNSAILENICFFEQTFYRKQSLDAPDQRPAMADISGVSVIRGPDTCGWRMRMEKMRINQKKETKVIK